MVRPPPIFIKIGWSLATYFRGTRSKSRKESFEERGGQVHVVSLVPLQAIIGEEALSHLSWLRGRDCFSKLMHRRKAAGEERAFSVLAALALPVP